MKDDRKSIVLRLSIGQFKFIRACVIHDVRSRPRAASKRMRARLLAKLDKELRP